MTQIHAPRHEHHAPEETSADVAAPDTEKSARDEKLKSDLDDILDEIDDVLETNAEEFVRGYVQKGGQ